MTTPSPTTVAPPAGKLVAIHDADQVIATERQRKAWTHESWRAVLRQLWDMDPDGPDLTVAELMKAYIELRRWERHGIDPGRVLKDAA